MERKYTVLTADIEEVKALLSKQNLGYQVTHEGALGAEKIWNSGYDPNHLNAFIIIQEIVK